MATSSNSPSIGNPPAEKLTLSNHLLWKAQIVPALRGARVLGLVERTEKAPPETLQIEKDGKTTSVPNTAYDTWLTRDQQVLSFLLTTLSPEILAQCIGLEHAADVWDLVNGLFISRTKANVTHLRGALSNTKKLSMTADEYVAKMRGFATELIAAGRVIEEDELVDLILNGLDEEYNGLFSTVQAMAKCTVSDLHGLIRAVDSRQNMLSGGGDGGDHKRFESSANLASRDRSRGRYNDNGRGNYNDNYNGRPRGRDEARRDGGGGGRRPPQGGRGHGRGGPPRYNNDNRYNDNRYNDIVCQICKKDGHAASTCWWRYADSRNNNEKEANAAYGVDTNWYPDTGATDHVTNNLEKLMIRDQYHGKDKIHTANGEGSSHGENSS